MTTDLVTQVLQAKEKSAAEIIVKECIESSDLLQGLVDLLSHDKKMVCQRASWPLVLIADQAPASLAPHLDQLVRHLIQPKSNTVLRNVLRILSVLDHYPENLEGHIYERCFSVLVDVKMPIACRVFAMTTCANISLQYAELIPELIDVIEEHVPHGSPGFKARAGDELRRLRRNK